MNKFPIKSLLICSFFILLVTSLQAQYLKVKVTTNPNPQLPPYLSKDSERIIKDECIKMAHLIGDNKDNLYVNSGSINYIRYSYERQEWVIGTTQLSDISSFIGSQIETTDDLPNELRGQFFRYVGGSLTLRNGETMANIRIQAMFNFSVCQKNPVTGEESFPSLTNAETGVVVLGIEIIK